VHIEILVEDSSAERLLKVLLPQFLGPQGEPHTWRLHAYKGIGRIPQGLAAKADPRSEFFWISCQGYYAVMATHPESMPL
jgi:hypothetical protein